MRWRGRTQHRADNVNVAVVDAEGVHVADGDYLLRGVCHLSRLYEVGEELGLRAPLVADAVTLGRPAVRPRRRAVNVRERAKVVDDDCERERAEAVGSRYG